jgi:predicted 3-demethylubiquinone-9 3-methyltransferase (glyoxalase superfamily)
MKIHPTQKIIPMLWFDSQAEEAAKFYVSIFKNSQITRVAHYPKGGPGPEGSVMVVSFELDGVPFTALNAGPQFKFTEAISFVISCDTQEEIDYFWEKLLAGGGKHSQCGWLKDRFGLSWQVTPSIWVELATGPHADRYMQAMMQMTKLDIAKLKASAAA